MRPTKRHWTKMLLCGLALFLGIVVCYSIEGQDLGQDSNEPWFKIYGLSDYDRTEGTPAPKSPREIKISLTTADGEEWEAIWAPKDGHAITTEPCSQPVISAETASADDERFEFDVTPDVGQAPEYNAVTATLETIGILTWEFDGGGVLLLPNQNEANVWLEPVYDEYPDVWVLDGNGDKIAYGLLSSGEQATAFLKHLRNHLIEVRRGWYVPAQVDTTKTTADDQVDTDGEVFGDFE